MPTQASSTPPSKRQTRRSRQSQKHGDVTAVPTPSKLTHPSLAVIAETSTPSTQHATHTPQTKGKAAPAPLKPTPRALSTTTPPSIAPADDFDPKSILPVHKAAKSMERLREALASARTGSAPTEYQCIDGTVRVSENPLPHASQPPLVTTTHPLPSKPQTLPLLAGSSVPRYVIYGIEASFISSAIIDILLTSLLQAYPTRALKPEVCQKFVSTTMFCAHGKNCHRIHPLDKAPYRLSKQQNTSASATAANDITVITTSPNAPTTPQVHSSAPKSSSSVNSSPISSSSHLLDGDSDVGRPRSEASITSEEGSLRDPESSPKTVISKAMVHPLPPRPQITPLPSKPKRRSPSPPRAQSSGTCAPSPPNPKPSLAHRQLPQERRYHPRTIDLCLAATRGACSLGFQCRFVHKDLTYEPRPPMTSRQRMRYYLDVEFGPGFSVVGLSSSCESARISISNLPHQTAIRDIMQLLKPLGKVDEVLLPTTRSTPMTIQVRFTKAAEGAKALAALHGTKLGGRTLSVQYLDTQRNSFVKENRLRLDWEITTSDCYCGFNTLDEAMAAVEKSKTIPYGGKYAVRGEIHRGIPRVGQVTVKFTGVPCEATDQGAQVWGPTTHVVWKRPSIPPTPLATGIELLKKSLRSESADFKELVLDDGPYRDGKIRAWAVFADDSDAPRRLGEEWRRFLPRWNDRKRVHVRHIKALVINIPPLKFFRIQDLMPDFIRLVRSQGHTYSFSINSRGVQTGSDVIVTIEGEDKKVLIRLKLELEQLLQGEVVRFKDEIIWHPFFGKPVASAFFRDLKRYCPGITVHTDSRRRCLRLFGDKPARRVVWRQIIERYQELISSNSRCLRLDNVLFTILASGGFAALESKVGEGNVVMDFQASVLRIRDDRDTFNTVLEMVEEARKRHHVPRPRVEGEYLCPVCFDSCTVPIWLDCDHVWCKSCLVSYLRSSIALGQFPLKCLGNDTSCSECIPLDVARDLLTPTEFESLTDAALSAYVRQNPKKFRYCPTTDCEQVYRVLPAGSNPIMCPSCLVQICAHCHTETHEGLSCDEVSNPEGLFKEWVGKNDVRQCPGCQMAIQKAEGCNHMKCTICQTHICWFCMQTFPKDGDGVYRHMSEVHGNYGLPEGMIPDEAF